MLNLSKEKSSQFRDKCKKGGIDILIGDKGGAPHYFQRLSKDVFNEDEMFFLAPKLYKYFKEDI